ncbi:MAG TPA: L,D-transpeptidase family protein [Hyphomicrobiaceae bacterium]|nr:L,D-transpeptidase family protein [Hyphomicrobiaceae bacterium]
MLAGIAIALLAVGAEAASRKSAGKPILAVVSLSDQRISIYDADGKILESPVSSGATGYETPAGIFTIVQKKEDHRSNLYEDGEMPFMQRITWTGIALHAGALPGYPASHGCVRMPFEFAQRLFGMTDMGMRVVVVREDMAPSAISHPALFKSKPVSMEVALAAQGNTRLASLLSKTEIVPGSRTHMRILQEIAAAKAQDVASASRQLREARTAASRAAKEATVAARKLKAGESALADAERTLKKLEARSDAATTAKAKEALETAKQKATATLAELQGQLAALRAKAQAKQEEAERSQSDAAATVVARDRAAEAAEKAEWRTSPVSVFVSRKTQRLYIRRGNNPVFEGPVAIREPDKPIGTFVFTAVEHLGASGDMRWNVVSMYENPTAIEPPPPANAKARPSHRGKGHAAVAHPTDVAAAGAALDRITFPNEALEHIHADALLPGTSLIVSDEGPSREIGKDTDFVVVMSDEPQGALKIRQRPPAPREQDYDPWADNWGGFPRESYGHSRPRRSYQNDGPFFFNW